MTPINLLVLLAAAAVMLGMLIIPGWIAIGVVRWCLRRELSGWEQAGLLLLTTPILSLLLRAAYWLAETGAYVLFGYTS